MTIIPFKKFILYSGLNSHQLRMKLDEQVEPFKGFRFDNYSKSSKLFVGKTNDETFDIRPVFKGRNSFIAYIHGNIQDKEGGSKIIVTMRLHFIVFFAILSFFIILPLLFAFKYHDKTGVFIPLFTYVMTIYFFNGEYNKSKDYLSRICETQTET